MNTTSRHDADLQMDDVSRAYRHAAHEMLNESPSAAIDDAIRAAARRGVSAGPYAARKSWFARMTVPMAAAASVILVGSLAFVAMREDPQKVTTLNEASAPMVTAMNKPDVGAPDARTAKAVEQQVAAVAARTQPPAKPLAPTAALPNSSLGPAGTATEKASAAETAREKKPATSSDASNATRATASTARPSETVAKRESETRRVAEPKRDGENVASFSPPPPPAPVPAPAPAAPPAPAPMMAPPVATAATPAASARRMADAPAQPNAETSTAGSGTSSGMSSGTGNRARASDSTAAPTLESPERWIRRMNTLLADDKTEQLHAELKRFRRAYPTAELPVSLSDEWLKIAD